MLFNTFEYFFFFAIVLTLFYASPLPARRWLLLAASYYFYAAWNPLFLPLLWTLTAIDYFAALWINRTTPEKQHRKLALLFSVAANLGFLGFFKYYNFAASNVAQLLSLPPQSLTLAIVLPLGISFHTFQSISYVVDVYRGEQEPIRDPIDYALFIAFFPQLVAGPIVRAREFFANYFHWKPPALPQLQRGMLEILSGLTKKMALADQFAPIADAYFRDPTQAPGALAAWSAVLAFAMQIYFDFSGYTDIAIGSARMLGYEFPDNFRRPYFAGSVTEFWRRWHISLSSWLRDYLYIPLGGNRHGIANTYRNLMITMLLGGLWHGANWTFVAWGAWQGLLLSIERSLGWTQARGIHRLWRVPFTFLLITIGWVFFRANSFGAAAHILRQMTAWGTAPGDWRIPIWILPVTAFGLFLPLRVHSPAWIVPYVFLLLLCLELFGVTDLKVPFVYFQF